MKLAVNYSSQAAALVRARAVDVDYFKCPVWPDVVEAAGQQRPVYVHFPFVAGRQEAAPIGVDDVPGWLARTSTLHVNTHLDLQPGSERGLFVRAEAAIARAVCDVRRLGQAFGPHRVVLENVPYWPDRQLHHRLSVRADVISHVVERAGCGLLLDLAHARLAADGLGLDVHDYLGRLPVHRLQELHVTGVQADADGWVRDHMPMQPTDWDLLEWVLGQIGDGTWARPHIIAFEYGGVGPRFEGRSDIDVLADQLPRLRHLLRVYDPNTLAVTRLSA